MMKKYIGIVLLMLLPALSFAQSFVTVSGTVRDEVDVLMGVKISQKGNEKVNTVTNAEGKYSIDVEPGSILEYKYIGLALHEERVGTSGKQTIDVLMTEDAKQLEEVSVVGFQTQRKVSVVGSISSVDAKDLQVGGVTSVSNALAGRIAGLIGVQRSGEPGQDVSEFWIRGISTFGANSSALILIDGIDRGAESLNELAPEDIESFSVLKDASATAVYGSRGANGVVLINTKRGQEGKMNISANVKMMVETLPTLPDYVGAYDYVRLANEAKAVRGDKSLYSEEVFDIIKNGMDPDLYPDVDWQKEILKKATWGLQANLNISGGSKVARYYMSGFFRTNDASYKQYGMDRYNANVRRNQYSFRSNIDVDATKTTKVALLLSAKLVDQKRPGIGNTSTIWQAASNLTPITVPVRFSNGQLPAYGKDEAASPSVLLNETGFVTERDNAIESKLQIDQDLKFITPGLNASASISFDNANSHTTTRKKMPNLYKAVDRNWNTGELITQKTVNAEPMSFNSSSSGERTIYFEGKLDYNKIIASRHRVGGLLLYYQKDMTRTTDNTERSSIPRRTQGLAARLTYSLDDIYFVEGNFGYNGSENFPKGERFGFFPSIALGYVLSNYEKVRTTLPFLNNLKLRYSYGLVGNDKIQSSSGAEVRFPYLTDINNNATGYTFGDQRENVLAGITESVIGSTGLVWESAVKQNFGIDLSLFNNSVDITVDAFLDRRNNIFMQRVSLPNILGIGTKPYGNVGKMKSWGADGTASYHKRIGEVDLEVRGNFTVTRDKIVDYDETTPKYAYLAKKGTSNNVTRGFIALGLFKDEADVKNSPTQFGTVLPGDIKYQDINGDGVIDDYDIVPIGNSNIPKLQYGFALAANWRGFDVNVFFRGASKVDYFQGGNGYFPFNGGVTGNVLTMVNDQKNRWTPAWYSGDPSTENPNAKFPRLTYGESDNNSKKSTFWLADASYLRLKTVEIGYTLPRKVLKRMHMNNLRISVVGDNLYVWDKVDVGDPEQASSNGAVYPLTRSYSLVLQMSF